ncbi:MAG: carbonate dehydratase [Shewanella sp.]|nr:carbonate dehydratase [Shewanella sp.]
MKILKPLFESNRLWAAQIKEENPHFFEQLATQQAPEYLWIGCSDSRVPSNQIIGLMPGEVFVHRNIANMVVHSDINCLSVIQYAVEVLKVKHIMVVGHYGCGGVRASMDADSGRIGLIDHWLDHLRVINKRHSEELNQLDDEAQFNRLCELNVIEQVANVVDSTIIQHAWKRGQNISVHGWIYSIENGLLNDLDVTVDRNTALSND